MIPWLRLVGVVAGSFGRARLGFMDESVLSFTVLPTDIDVNLHMNNARYLALMDLGRADLILRTGLWRLVWAHKLKPVIGAATVRFRRSLAPFERMTLYTRLLGWDERWIYLEHRFERGGQVVCSALVTAVFLHRGSRYKPAELAERAGWPGPSPALPPAVALWQALDRQW